jgi:nitrate reductase assembly molybdenum cofactor insertion protein NarJ
VLLLSVRAQASDAVLRLPQLQAEYAALEARYAAAVELLGERDETLEEMAADLADVKQLYKQQIEALVAQLAAAGDAGGNAAAG